jgi:SNF2 family DNA or RNA helicase
MDAFNRPDSQQRVLIVSLMAGGTGINLQGANHVVLFDRWWNPAIELQAEDRAHRLNGLRPVTVHRITTRNSIEENIERKIKSRLQLVKDVMDPQLAVEKLITREDLLEIFGVSN